jgi:hypothetical protein
MRKQIKHILAMTFALSVTGINAQTMNIVVGDVTYAVPASAAGDMTYNSGTSITILNKTYSLTDIDQIYIDNSTVTENEIDVNYSTSSAKVVIDGRIAQYLESVSVTGANVALVQSDNLAKELTYKLSGATTSGSFCMDGSYKATVELNGVSITSTNSMAPITILNGKRINVVLTDGTTSTLVDNTSNEYKGCFYAKGHLEFDGSGTLNITGKSTTSSGNALWAKEYVQLKAGFGTLNILGAVGDGINCNYYYQQNGGTVTITGVGDDGIQSSIRDNDDDADNIGAIIIKGGTINATVTAKGAKGLKADGSITINNAKSKPSVTISTSGAGYYDSDDAEGKASACITADSTINISAGTFNLTSTSAATGSKLLKSDGNMTITGGTFTLTNNAPCVIVTDTLKSNCIKIDGNGVITGGNFTIKNTGSGGKCLNVGGTLTLGTYTSTALSAIDKETLVMSCTTTGSTFGSSSSGGGGGRFAKQYAHSGPGGWGGPDGPEGDSSDGVKAKAIRAQGDLTVNNGYIYCSTSADGSEGLESKSNVVINNGNIVCDTYDDAINAKNTINIKGGFIYAHASGNDAIDANGTSGNVISISGGIVLAFGTTSPEEGLDLDKGYINITGGYVFTGGGQQQSSPSRNGTQCSYWASYSMNSSYYYTLECDGTKLFTVKAPTTISQNYSLISATGMSTGKSCKLYYGSSTPTSYGSVYADKSTNRFWLSPTVSTSGTTKSWTQSSTNL